MEAPADAIGAIQLYGTLYLDMLGWGDELLALDRLILKGHEAKDRKELMGRVVPTLKKYELVRSVMDKALRMAFEESKVNQALAEKLGPDGAAFLESVHKPRTIYSSFSDCFVLSLPLAKHPRFGPIPLLLHLHGLMTCGSIAFVILLGEGIPVRGAIEVGVGAELQRDPAGPLTFVGASLAKAYKVERGAGHPRIQLGPSALDFCNWAVNQKASFLDQVRPGAATLVKSLVMKEDDGSFSVDYLKVHTAPDLSKPSIQGARRFIDQQLAEAKVQGDAERVRRYALLSTYFDSRQK